MGVTPGGIWDGPFKLQGAGPGPSYTLLSLAGQLSLWREAPDCLTLQNDQNRILGHISAVCLQKRFALLCARLVKSQALAYLLKESPTLSVGCL